MKKLLEFIQINKPVALLAPSFPVDFNYPEIISILKGLGCAKVVELTYAAKLINKQYHEHLKNHPEQQRICSNCPTIVQYIKNKFPEHKDKLMPIASPMIIMSRFVKKQYGDNTKTLFVGPCLAKKIEAKMTGEVDEAITFKELQELIEYAKTQGITIDTQKESEFNNFYNNSTKIYPLDGAVAQTMNRKDILTDDQIIITDGISQTNEAIKRMESDPNIKFLDLLSCPGGCVGGPGIISKEDKETKAQKIRDYQQKMKEKEQNSPKKGKIEYANGLDYKNTFI
ncbi:MAG: [Fe-Fe] hydrogenase large subunit C-terminal domain-containing protein [Candidatus Absconditabacteria bacterium]|nr:[Fe-Fe] hydrogenase large subunit C-terminal domain-containing protein [Candidatus Absconditabacteria bacterium]